MNVSAIGHASGPRVQDSDKRDVIVVGARCAGATIATLLARAGLKVTVIEQTHLPKSTLSSNLIEADGIAFLNRIGLRDQLEATGVRFMTQLVTRLNDVHVSVPFPLKFDDLGGAVFLRRYVLDEILANEASRSGAEVRMGSRLVGLLWEKGRVVGVECEGPVGVERIYAPLVIGADGRSSSVANLVGSHRYNVTGNQRSYYFTLFEGASESGSDAFVFHRWGDRMVWAGPADNGLYLVGVSPEAHERDYFATNKRAGLLAHMRSCEPVAAVLEDARISEQIMGIRNFDGYFRQASGPGWVLLGDAGHFKDPAAGRGMGDAFMQVDTLATAIVAGLDVGSDVDSRLRAWGRWRDRKFAGHYWMATELGRAGAFPAVISEAIRELEEEGRIDEYADLYSHRAEFYNVFPAWRIAQASAKLLKSGRAPRVKTIKECVSLFAREPRHRWINVRPALDTSDIRTVPALRSTRAARQSETEGNGPNEPRDGSEPSSGESDSTSTPDVAVNASRR